VSVEDDEHSGQSSTTRTTENIEKIRDLIHEDRRRTIHELAGTVGINYGVCQILKENLNMCRIAAKFVPRLLTKDQKHWHINVCLKLQEKATTDPTFTNISRIITGNKSWIYSYDPETRQQSSQWKSPQSPRAKKAWQVRSSTKSMLTNFYDVKGIVHREFVPPNTTVNSDSYCDVLREYVC
jgi:histone-lysine N-methyltransferase SETMAR